MTAQRLTLFRPLQYIADCKSLATSKQIAQNHNTIILYESDAGSLVISLNYHTEIVYIFLPITILMLLLQYCFDLCAV